ncbi:MAG: hypothetical protein ACRDZV_13105 [Acidimicrobiia bacterium]
MHRAFLPAVALAFLVVAGVACDSSDRASPPVRVLAPGQLEPYEDLGTWVDVYDYVPEFQQGGAPPAVTPESVDDMAALGVRTLYLQAAQEDARSPGDTIDPDLLGKFVRRAHRNDVAVVGWYLPRLADLDADLRHVRAIHRFQADGERFDGLALDLEWTEGVPDVPARNDALVDFSERVRDLVGERGAVAAIVLEPVLLEVVNPLYWPDFPWQRIEPLYDVWMPMSYWTNRTDDSGYREGFRYTEENVRRLRRNLRDENATVHTIGGIGDGATPADYEGFVRASREAEAVGWSVYDFNTISTSAWPRLRG